jgi:hypothetical protein
MTAREEFDPLAPQREAAFFYGLFLRGHDVETLRQDIDVPRSMIESGCGRRISRLHFAKTCAAYTATANRYWRSSTVWY